LIQKLWLYPPLALARVGRSTIECDSFNWGPNDLRPRGTGKTMIEPSETLKVSEDGTVTSNIPSEIVFKDSAGWRRVCPFFELHGEWMESGIVSQGPVTPQILRKFGKTANDLKWRVQVANWKAFNYTENTDDQIAAKVDLEGDVTQRRILRGTSPADAREPLVPVGQHIELGSVQLTKPTDKFSVFRLRFSPAPGWVYGPTNLNDRLTDEAVKMEMYKLAPERRILNPNASWCHFDTTVRMDDRTTPSGEYATDQFGISLGIIDDICDGLISCSIEGIPIAFARISVGPPKINPDRRAFTSLADGLTDRVRRDDVNNLDYVKNAEMTSLEIQDFLERVGETMGVMNVDAQNDRGRLQNMAIAQQGGFSGDAIREAADKAFPQMEPEIKGRIFPLSELARQNHRRFFSMEVFEDILRERPEIIDERIRKPRREPEDYYDRKMPVAMRGSDGNPMTITRRQYDLLKGWQKRLRRDVEE
jgi:hypothetical protein